jgi:hypothetical protein
VDPAERPGPGHPGAETGVNEYGFPEELPVHSGDAEGGRRRQSPDDDGLPAPR